MDNRVKLAAVALCCVIAAAVVSVAAKVLLQVDGGTTLIHEAELTDAGRPWRAPANQSVVGEPRRPARVAELAQMEGQIGLLRTSLARKDAALEKQETLLAERSAEIERLRRELADYLDLAAAFGASAGQPPDSDSTAARDTQVETEEIQALQVRLAESITARERLEAELEQARRAAASADNDLFDLELARSFEREQAMRDAVGEAVRQIGAPAVPALTRLLADDRADLRSWAASLLGSLQDQAEAAVAALRDAQSDPDPQVRQAVTSALHAILD